MFYKIEALHKAGIKIHLHCFEYGRGQQPELNQYCEEIFYYQRSKSISAADIRLPYIVRSRINSVLLTNLLQNNYPVLLEGIHCSYYLYHGDLRNRKVLVRLHNVEYEYYAQLASATRDLYKKIYYKLESRLLKNYEHQIAKKAKFIAVSKKDEQTYKTVFGGTDIEFLPVFLPFNKVQSQIGKGEYCLYHGNLSVAENEKAALWLLEKVASESDIRIVIAGKNPSSLLISKVEKNRKAQLIQNPSQAEMEGLIKNAHIHLLPSFNSTGIKIKLLSALFNGRFVVTSPGSLEKTGLESLCFIAADAQQYIERIGELKENTFSEDEISKRIEILEKLYDNEKNAKQLMNWL